VVGKVIARRAWAILVLFRLALASNAQGFKRTAATGAGIITATVPTTVAALGVVFTGER
jgi:drug/metabolite transporter (DMT)-like permease